MNDIRKARLMQQIKELLPEAIEDAMKGPGIIDCTLGTRKMADNTIITLKLVVERKCPPGVTRKPGVNPRERRKKTT